MSNWRPKQQAELLELNLGKVERQPGLARRAQHPKHHGCVAARFVVHADIPVELRAGLFAEPASHVALVRFSNGRSADDRRNDAHGMAIKLLDVGGDAGTVQDFVLVDHETFFTGDPDTYMLVHSALLGRSLARRIVAWLGLFLRPRLLLRIRAFVGKQPRSPLASAYFSTVPYRLGSAIVKYAAIPRPGPIPDVPEGSDMLASVLQVSLEAGSASFDFFADVQNDGEAQPIDNPAINWREKGAQRIALAVLEIPAQRVDPNSSLAENLAFSPWHALPAHEPLGLINAARRRVYEAVAVERHRVNDIRPDASAGAPESYGVRPMPRESLP